MGSAAARSAWGQKRPVTSFTAAYFTILKIVVIACYEAAMIRFIFDLGVRLTTFVALAAAFFRKSGAGQRARNRPWARSWRFPCQFPAGRRGRGNVFPASRARELTQAIDCTRNYRRARADFSAEIKISLISGSESLRPAQNMPAPRIPSTRVEAGHPRRRGGRGKTYDSVAVVGSIIRRTSVILLAGKPLRRACS